ncbi:253_t:CDS:2, partial [Paraglomus brasilianum]
QVFVQNRPSPPETALHRQMNVGHTILLSMPTPAVASPAMSLHGDPSEQTSALLVGVTCVAKSGFLSGLNNLAVYPLHGTDVYNDKFGFTEKEVECLVRHHGTSDAMTEIKSWYNGYVTGTKIAEQLENDKQSELHYITHAKVLQKITVDVEVQSDLCYDNLYSKGDSALWAILYYSGYLSLDINHSSIARDAVNISTLTLVVPNMEVLHEWKQWIGKSWTNMGISKAETLVDHLLQGELDKFSKEFPDYVLDRVSYYGVGSSKSGSSI